MEKAQLVIDEVKKVIVGKEETIEKILMTILAKGHILLEDIPGVGKTTLALAFSKSMGLDFKRIQFTPDVVASDIVGFTVYSKEREEFIYKEGTVMCNLLLGDEINRTSSRTQSALLEAMEEGNVTVDGVTYEIPKPFNVIATQNPVGSYGTQPLPATQLDRFMVKVKVGYPDFQSQVELLRGRQNNQPLDKVVPVISKEELIQMQQQVSEIHISDTILEYVTTLTEVTRNHPAILQGISPRGAIAVCNMSKSKAFISGRSYVIPEDVMAVFNDTCSHRLLLNQRAQIDQFESEELLKDILNSVQSPDLTSLVKN